MGATVIRQELPMNPPEKGIAYMAPNRSRGFTLLELMITLTVLMIASAVVLMGVQPSLNEAHVGSAYNLTLNVLRQARDTTIGQRQTYYVTFNNGVSPNTITVTPGFGTNAFDTYKLPTDVSYTVLAKFPTSPLSFPMTPDGFGTGATPIDFDQGIALGVKNIVYFQPDGSAQDVNGNINNGVIYIARPGDLYSAKAITLWGATGRIRGWRLDQNAGAVYYWRQQ